MLLVEDEPAIRALLDAVTEGMVVRNAAEQDAARGDIDSAVVPAAGSAS